MEELTLYPKVTPPSLPALYEIRRTLTFRWIFAICLIMMLVTLGMLHGGPVLGHIAAP